MKLTATIRVDLVTDSPEAADYLLKVIAGGIHPGVKAFARNGQGVENCAHVIRASITRVRPVRRPKKVAR